jgi:hypothetical protein
MWEIRFNNPSEEFTLGIHLTKLNMAELNEGEIPDEDTEWSEMYKVNIGLLIFDIVFYV